MTQEQRLDQAERSIKKLTDLLAQTLDGCIALTSLSSLMAQQIEQQRTLLNQLLDGQSQPSSPWPQGRPEGSGNVLDRQSVDASSQSVKSSQ